LPHDTAQRRVVHKKENAGPKAGLQKIPNRGLRGSRQNGGCAANRVAEDSCVIAPGWLSLQREIQSSKLFLPWNQSSLFRRQ